MTHKWDYKYPGNFWETMPWWVRWPLAVLLTCYIGGGMLAFTIAMLHAH
jgi:hypothetical protein